MKLTKAHAQTVATLADAFFNLKRARLQVSKTRLAFLQSKTRNPSKAKLEKHLDAQAEYNKAFAALETVIAKELEK